MKKSLNTKINLKKNVVNQTFFSYRILPNFGEWHIGAIQKLQIVSLNINVSEFKKDLVYLRISYLSKSRWRHNRKNWKVERIRNGKGKCLPHNYFAVFRIIFFLFSLKNYFNCLRTSEWRKKKTPEKKFKYVVEKIKMR